MRTVLTRCPACDTTFRITPEQLKARTGKVRCGACQHVFNAIDTLVEEAPVQGTFLATVEPLMPAVPPGIPATGTPADPVVDAPVAVAPPPTPDENAALSPESGTEPVMTADSEPDPAFPTAEPFYGAAPQAPELPPPGSAAAVAPAEEAPTETGLADATAEQLDPFGDEPRPRRWPWVIGSVAALLALGAQAALHYRVELAVVAPSARPLLEAACEFAGCTVGLPSKVEMMTIETSDLQPHPDQAGRLTLTALLRNRAPFSQAYPHLELSLTDTADKVLARRVLTPADYLRAVPAAARGTMIDNGIPPGETPVSLPIQSGEAAAAGYRLYLFYP